MTKPQHVLPWRRRMQERSNQAAIRAEQLARSEEVEAFRAAVRNHITPSSLGMSLGDVVGLRRPEGGHP